MKIIETLKVNEINTKEVETAKGTKKVLSLKHIHLSIISGVFGYLTA